MKGGHHIGRRPLYTTRCRHSGPGVVAAIHLSRYQDRMHQRRRGCCLGQRAGGILRRARGRSCIGPRQVGRVKHASQSVAQVALRRIVHPARRVADRQRGGRGLARKAVAGIAHEVPEHLGHGFGHDDLIAKGPHDDGLVQMDGRADQAVIDTGPAGGEATEEPFSATTQ